LSGRLVCATEPLDFGGAQRPESRSPAKALAGGPVAPALQDVARIVLNPHHAKYTHFL
jgi:hypothetical protein